MTDLPQRYSALVAKRPELAVKNSTGCPLAIKHHPAGGETWYFALSPDHVSILPHGCSAASALIQQRLTEALPCSFALLPAKTGPRNEKVWLIYEFSDTGGLYHTEAADSPLEALFSFHESLKSQE